MRIFLILSGLLLIHYAYSSNIRLRRDLDPDLIVSGATCDKKVNAFFVVDNAQFGGEATATYDDVSEEDCTNYCSQNKDGKGTSVLCASFTYDPKLFRCSIHHEKSIPDGTKMIENQPGKRYFEKFCIDEDLPSECLNAQFIRVQQSVIFGYAKNFSSEPTLERCVMKCLKEEFACKSAMYFYEEGECITNTESALTVPASFAQEESDKVVYFQNGCEKALEIQSAIAAEIEAKMKSLNISVGDDLKNNEMLDNHLETKPEPEPEPKEPKTVAAGGSIDSEIIKETDERLVLEGSQRTPELVKLPKDTDDDDDNEEDDPKPAAEHPEGRTPQAVQVQPRKGGDPDEEDAKALEDKRKPQAVEVLPRKVYQATVEKFKNVKVNETPLPKETKDSLPEVVKEVVKEVVPASKPAPEPPAEEKEEIKDPEEIVKPIEEAQAKVPNELFFKESAENQVGSDTQTSSKVEVDASSSADNKPPAAQPQLEMSGMSNKEIDEIKSALRKYNKLKIDTSGINEKTGYFSEWGPWSPCRVSGERKVRRRRCVDLRKCVGPLMELQTCKPEEIEENRKPAVSAASVRTIVSAGPSKVEELPDRTGEIRRETDEGKSSSMPPAPVIAVEVQSSPAPLDGDSAIWAPWEGICKQFPNPQPCRDNKQIGFESRECLATEPKKCVGPFFRYCTINC